MGWLTVVSSSNTMNPQDNLGTSRNANRSVKSTVKVALWSTFTPTLEISTTTSRNVLYTIYNSNHWDYNCTKHTQWMTCCHNGHNGKTLSKLPVSQQSDSPSVTSDR